MTKIFEDEYDLLADLLSDADSIGHTFEIEFHYGSQEEDLCGGGYDDDDWTIEERHFPYGKKYRVYGYTLREVCKKAIKERERIFKELYDDNKNA